jgi:DNA polymerase III alpha subunit
MKIKRPDYSSNYNIRNSEGKFKAKETRVLAISDTHLPFGKKGYLEFCIQLAKEYKTLDIAEYVLALCKNEAELQRCGHELLLYQEKDLFNLLRYLKYLVDVMTENNVIWGVGRGSSVASYVLYKLGVHRIDSMFYDLEPTEFLR